MKKTIYIKHLIKPLFFILISLTFIFCSDESISPTETGVGLKLEIKYSGDGLTKILDNNSDMNIATYDIIGIGPNNAGITQTDIILDNIEIPDLVTGAWSAAVFARNTKGKIIASGSAAFTITTSRLTEVIVTVTPVSGTGTLLLSVSCPEISQPEITAVLMPEGKVPFDLPLIIDINNLSAAYADSALTAGKYTLSIIIKSGANLVWSKTVSLNILEGQLTTIQYALIAEDLGNILLEGSYYIFSDVTPAANKFIFITDGKLSLWNNIVKTKSDSPYEGNDAWKIKANAGVWWGMGITHSPGKDFSAYTQGSLNIALKTTSKDHFKIGIKNGSIESWIHFNDGNDPYGFSRDGQWQMVQIPFCDFINQNFHSLNNLTQIFMFSGNIPNASVTIEIDNIYYDATPAVISGKAKMISPMPFTTLPTSQITFKWNTSTTATEYKLSISTNLAALDINPEIYNQSLGTTTSANVYVPANNKTIYVRLWSKINNEWVYLDYTYKAYFKPAQMTSPSDNKIFKIDNMAKFQWDAGHDIAEYKLCVATTAELRETAPDLFNQSLGTQTSANVSGIPLDCSLLYVRLWSRVGSDWFYKDYTYTYYQDITPVNIGNTFNGVINVNTDIDIYRFTGTAGDKVFIGFARTYGGGLFNVRIRLFNENGNQLAYKDASYPAVGNTLTATLPSNGTYYIFVSEMAYDNIGNYSFTLQRSNNPGACVSMSYGNTRNSTINANADIDAFSFTGTTGDNVSIEFARTYGGGLFNVGIRLFDENGKQLAYKDAVYPAVGNTLTATLPDDSTYYIFVSELAYDNTGNYSLSLSKE